MEKEEIERIIQERLDPRLRSIEQGMSDIADIRRVLLGDGKYSKEGLKHQHDLMFDSYRDYKRENYPQKMDTLWRTHENYTDNGFYEKIKTIIELYTSIRLMMGIFGVTSILSLILSSLSLLKFFG